MSISVYTTVCLTSHRLTVVVCSWTHSARIPSELLGITYSVMESLYDIVDVIAKIVSIDNMVEAFRRDVER